MISHNKSEIDFSFRPDQSSETYNVVDFETYIRDVAPKQIKYLPHDLPHDFVDFPAINRIKHLFTGFMIAPVAIYKGKSLTAKSRKILSLSEIESLSTEAKASNANLFLYELSFCPSFPQYQDFNQETAEVYMAPNELIVQQNWWILRYAAVTADIPRD